MVEAKDRECDGADRDDPGLQRRLSGGLDVADTRSPEKHALVEPAKCPGLIAANGDKHLLQQGKEQWTPTTPTDENKKAFSQKRQFLACAAVQTMAVLGGLAIAHSSSLLPALSGPDSEVPITPQQGAWIASSLVLAVPLGSMLGLLLNDVLGRLTLIKIIALPQVLGWVLVATAGSLAQIVGARFILGTALGMSHSFTTLYISEVADKDIRGGLGALGTALASLGILLCYTMGAFLDWRTHAWANCCLPVLPLALLFTLATESPVWLRERGRDEEAARASTFFYDDPTKAVFIIQQLVGIYITIYYAVPLFMETGCTLDPYLASILIGVVRLVGCTSVSWAMRRLGRRPLMLASSAGQAVAMATSGYATARILQ
ncbi:hypothetical protein FOCC_FOCC017245, partial [Frankliniella occidentalis]